MPAREQVRSRERYLFPRGRPSAAPGPTMHRTRIRTAHGPACTMWIRAPTARSGRSVVYLEFLDPRAGVEAVTAPGDPYGEPFRVRPQAGLLVVFPSWLYHWVHPYAGQTPRIAISFNATLAPVAANEPSAAVRPIPIAVPACQKKQPCGCASYPVDLQAAAALASWMLFASSARAQDPQSAPTRLETRSDGDAGREWRDPGAASKTRGAAKDDLAIDGRVAAAA